MNCDDWELIEGKKEIHVCFIFSNGIFNTDSGIIIDEHFSDLKESNSKKEQLIMEEKHDFKMIFWSGSKIQSDEICGSTFMNIHEEFIELFNRQRKELDAYIVVKSGTDRSYRMISHKWEDIFGKTYDKIFKSMTPFLIKVFG